MKIGTFIRVRDDHFNLSRAGKDGMVVYDFKDGFVGLTFGFDRYNEPQNCTCVGSEFWSLDELDLSTAEPPCRDNPSGADKRRRVQRFWLQPTASFQDGAPQRESYATDAAHDADCERYAREWRASYECCNKECLDCNCPQHGSRHHRAVSMPVDG